MDQLNWQGKLKVRKKHLPRWLLEDSRKKWPLTKPSISIFPAVEPYRLPSLWCRWVVICRVACAKCFYFTFLLKWFFDKMWRTCWVSEKIALPDNFLLMDLCSSCVIYFELLNTCFWFEIVVFFCRMWASDTATRQHGFTKIWNLGLIWTRGSLLLVQTEPVKVLCSSYCVAR